jgi:L-threonylcarbamoyladenylate synthase
VKRFQLSGDPTDAAAIREAADVITGGGLVAFPTETVYGLGANALDPRAIARLYATKGRPAHNPLIVHCADTRMARELAAEWTADAEALATAFWPGPLTLVVPKLPVVGDVVTAGLPTVALRVPRHPVAKALLERCRLPIAAPSANLSTELSPTTAEHVTKSLAEGVDVVLDAGATPVGIESCVVDLSGPDPVLLRPGTIPVSDLESVLGKRVSHPRAFAGRGERCSPERLNGFSRGGPPSPRRECSTGTTPRVLR